MKNELEHKAVEILDQISDKLGTGVEHFWPMAVKDEVTRSSLALCIGSVMLMLAVWCAYKAKNSTSKLKELYCLICASLSLIGGVIVIVSIPILLNPEWYALKKLLNLIN